jgi:ribosomal protein S12
MKELSRVEAELKQAMDRVDALKREVATRKAALDSLADSPKKGQKTRKVASKPKQPKSAQPKSAQSQQVNCPSHKTKDECPESVCVWGKTGKCSKKRAKKE